MSLIGKKPTAFYVGSLRVQRTVTHLLVREDHLNLARPLSVQPTHNTTAGQMFHFACDVISHTTVHRLGVKRYRRAVARLGTGNGHFAAEFVPRMSENRSGGKTREYRSSAV